MEQFFPFICLSPTWQFERSGALDSCRRVFNGVHVMYSGDWTQAMSCWQWYHWRRSALLSTSCEGDMMFTHPNTGGVNLDHLACCSLPSCSTLKPPFPTLQWFIIWFSMMGSYFNIVLISGTSFGLCPPASASIDSACLNHPFFGDGWKMAILRFLHWVVDILQEKIYLLFHLFAYSFSYICRFSWIPILLWVVIYYYHYLCWCSNCSHCGHWGAPSR